MITETKDFHESQTEFNARQALTLAGFEFKKTCAESFKFQLGSKKHTMFYSSNFKILVSGKPGKGEKNNTVYKLENLETCIQKLKGLTS